MKPKEFDELIRQKFDQDDFAYNSRNWDALAEKLDGRAKKRSLIVWWWVPLAGMAASVALAAGSSSLLRHSISLPAGAKTELSINSAAAHHAQKENNGGAALSSHKDIAYAAASPHKNAKPGLVKDKDVNSWFHINLSNQPVHPNKGDKGTFNFLAASDNVAKSKIKKDEVAIREGINTFIPAEEVARKAPKVFINLLGGYNSGSEGTGYTLGGTVRRMISENVYVESDVAFTSSNNMQSTQYSVVQVNTAAASMSAAGRHAAARTSNADAGKTSTVATTETQVDMSSLNYNLYYAQVNPGLGVKLVKRLSVGLGPDFQRMLVDNRPVVSTSADRNNIQVAPLFDVGFVGKTEYMVTKRVKTAISYRKGMNDLISPSDKYINRDYLQFQLRYTIFNK